MAVTGVLRAQARRSAGSRVGPFRLERYLGGGGDTEVWRADGDGIVVALKLRRPGLDDPLATARLAREAAVLRTVRHPALIALLDSAEDDGEPYLAFTFHDGPTLAEHLDDGRLSPVVAAAAFAPVADALAALHAQHVVHRDMKPANVLLTADGPLLLDAGHASIAGTTYDGWVDAAPALAGTTSYLAPEAAHAPPAPPLDVFALGVAIVEATTGRARADAAADAPEPLRALLVACTDPNPDHRPSAATVAAALHDVAGTTPAPRGRERPAMIDLTRDDEVVVHHERRADRASGRAAELTVLTDAAADGALAQELRAVLVTAPPGTGKSWLVDAAASRVERAGGRVVRAACSEARGDVRVVAPWLLELGHGEEGAAQLAALAGPAPGAALLRALGLQRTSEAEVDAAVVADALATVLAHGAPSADGSSAAPPVVCIVEDLHHASLELLDLLSRLALRAGVRGALWCTTRPSWVDPDELGFEVLALGPLTADAIADLVGETGTRETARVDEIVAVAGGNPLHAREAALALERGESLANASSLPELIAARFASYEPPLRDALGLAAACGNQFWPEALGREFLERVPELYRSGVAQACMSSALTASTEAHFRHPLLREVAYASLDDARRRELHGELGRVLDAAAAPPEVVAGQAGTAFRLGDQGAAVLAARAAADAGRDALDRLSLQAAEEWIALLRETRQEPEDGLADLLDTELALDRGEYDRARALVGDEPERGSLAARRLALATRAAYGTGDLADAERFGARALDGLAGRPVDAAAHTFTYARVLSRTGDHERALALLDRAADLARGAGETGLAARLAAEAAQVASDMVRADSRTFTDAVARTRAALAEQRSAGDVRGFIASAPAFVETLVIDTPAEALDLAIDAAEKARDLGEIANFGPLVIAVCTAALEAGAAGALEQWVPLIGTTPLDTTSTIEAGCVSAMARGARSAAPVAVAEDLLALADRYVALGDVTRADSPEIGALCSLLWTGQESRARALFDTRVRAHLPHDFAALFELVFRALSGPPFEAGPERPETTMAHNELALLHMLRGEWDAADALLRARYRDRLLTAETPRQRFGPYFPGALVSALGPPDTEPDVDWLLGWIHDPPFPGLWIVHRAICALLLSERAEPPEAGLADHAIALLGPAEADASVLAWIGERAESGPRRDGGV